MIRATFRLRLPTDLWVSELSRAFPAATFELLAGVPDGDAALEVGQLRARSPTGVVDAVRSHTDIREYTLLFADDYRALAGYEVTDQRLYELLREFAVPLPFPLSVADGWMEFGVTLGRRQFEAIEGALQRADYEYERVSVVRGDSPGKLLTDRQQECLRLAVHCGYYEIPKECTLADLAAQLDVDPSTVSETLRRAEQRIVRRFVHQ